jgi:hypothetical protein
LLLQITYDKQIVPSPQIFQRQVLAEEPVVRVVEVVGDLHR